MLVNKLYCDYFHTEAKTLLGIELAFIRLLRFNVISIVKEQWRMYERIFQSLACHLFKVVYDNSL